ncbi:MAG: tRNA (adenosine(37)-N6)-threonylcarbamoyltransferase complex dimerization subunit type 1 TsaB [Desulfatiglandales bacterium]
MLLAINTSTPQFSIGLVLENGSLVAEFSLSPGSNNFFGLMPAIDHLLVSSSVEPGEIKAVVVAKGPGSFTGLRVGISTAKGLCQGLGIPIIGVSSLEAMASQATFAGIPVCPLIDSRKGEVFTALFRWSKERGIERLTEETSLKIGDLASFAPEKTLFLGHDFGTQGPLVAGLMGRRRASLAPAPLWYLRAASVGVLGMRRYLDQDFDDLRDLVPAYLRPPDIRPNPFPLLSG